MFYDEYTHMKCKCGGIIGMRDGKIFHVINAEKSIISVVEGMDGIY